MENAVDSMYHKYFMIIKIQKYEKQESLALASMARDDPPASSMAAAMRGIVGSEFET